MTDQSNQDRLKQKSKDPNLLTPQEMEKLKDQHDEVLSDYLKRKKK